MAVSGLDERGQVGWGLDRDPGPRPWLQVGGLVGMVWWPVLRSGQGSSGGSLLGGQPG